MKFDFFFFIYENNQVIIKNIYIYVVPYVLGLQRLHEAPVVQLGPEGEEGEKP